MKLIKWIIILLIFIIPFFIWYVTAINMPENAISTKESIRTWGCVLLIYIVIHYSIINVIKFNKWFDSKLK